MLTLDNNKQTVERIYLEEAYGQDQDGPRPQFIPDHPWSLSILCLFLLDGNKGHLNCGKNEFYCLHRGATLMMDI